MGLIGQRMAGIYGLLRQPLVTGQGIQQAYNLIVY